MENLIARKARKGETVMLERGDSFVVTRTTRDGDVYGINDDGSEFGPYELHEYRVDTSAARIIL